jgi:gliding motility-associated-like protein
MLAPSRDTSYRYKWQNGDSLSKLTVTSSGSYSVSAKKNGCTNTASIHVDYISLPRVELGKDTTLCEGNSLSLSVDPSDAKYLWSTGSTSNKIDAASTGTFWVNVSKSTCLSTDTLHLVVKQFPVITLQNDTIICAGTSLTLSPSSNTSYKYKWQNGDTSNNFIVTTAGIYSVTAKNDECTVADTIKIGTLNSPVINLADTFICKQGKLLLDLKIAPDDVVVWQDQSIKHTYLVTTPGVYAVRTSNKCGTDSKQITVTEKLCELVMPTAFTPNNDGRNDVFRIKYPEFVKSLHLSIYNRMGQKIFETSDPYKGWDGTINGMPQPMGTYIYNLAYTDVENNKQMLKGYLVMVR